MSRGRTERRINLALQGGGAHGAYTWGVLDRLLEEPQIELGWTSGTSAGAVNAVALAAGIAAGGYAAARTVLRHVWEKVMAAATPDLVRSNPLLATFYHMAGMSNMSALVSPYDFNPLGIDPLRRILEDAIDFAAIRRHPGHEVLIAATDVETGLAQIFRRERLTVDHVLASACLPTLHHAVEIEGRLYWDGGFSANPDLITLALESPVRDTLLIELNPRTDASRPRSASAIAARVAAITFSQPLVRDLQMIAAAKGVEVGFLASARRGQVMRLKRHHFHIIEAGRHTAQLGQETKVQADRRMVTHLFEVGRTDADVWIGAHLGDIGRRDTLDLTRFQPVASPSRGERPRGRAGPELEWLTEPPRVTAPGSILPFSGTGMDRRRPR